MKFDGDIIRDQTDPAKMGMFSEMGRFSSEKYPIILKRDDILQDKRKKFKVNDLPDYFKDEEEELGEEELSKSKELPEKKVRFGLEPAPPKIRAPEFKKYIDRYEHYVYKIAGSCAPPPDRYMPKQFMPYV